MEKKKDRASHSTERSQHRYYSYDYRMQIPTQKQRSLGLPEITFRWVRYCPRGRCPPWRFSMVPWSESTEPASAVLKGLIYAQNTVHWHSPFARPWSVQTWAGLQTSPDLLWFPTADCQTGRTPIPNLAKLEYEVRKAMLPVGHALDK